MSYKDDRIKYIKHEINQGAGCARDTGIKNCSGEYIQFLDSAYDDLDQIYNFCNNISLNYALKVRKQINESINDCKEITTESSTQPCHQKIKFIDRFLKKLGEVVDALD